MGFPTGLLSIIHTVLPMIIIGTIFRWLKGRGAARKDANQIERNRDDPNPGGDDAVPDIFLSHSGKQKPFVERLYDELERTNLTVFFDQHSLPKGSPFPRRIKQAARGCKLGVVVLSEDFLTSKWPMLELEILVSRWRTLVSQGRGPELHVLPLFFRLLPEDLKSPTKLSKWRKEWKKLGCADSEKQWEEAIKDLGSFNGEVFAQGTSEGAYIKKVVQHICTLVPSHVPYDCSLIQGRSRLAQEIASKFQRLDAIRARMVGLYGVGGLGKTSLCKVMVNHYSNWFCGRSFLLEFPSPGTGDMPTVVLQCKKALDKLTDASDKHLLSDADDFDQVVQMMRGRVGRHDIFLAVDNVWEKFLEEAKRVLRVGFSANSKILVMSRSEEVLKDLLRGPVSNVIVDPLPALECEEALHIFQETLEQDHLGNLVGSEQIKELLEGCRFSGSYHALALKALAKYVKRVCMSANSTEGIEHQVSCVLKEISSKDLSEVDKVIRLSYDSLPEPKKHLFLDIAVFFSEYRKEGIFSGVEEWVSLLYAQSPRIQTTKLMIDLSLDGLIQTEERWDGQKAVGLHDLYYEFATREIASSRRFWVEGITNQSVEKVDPEELAVVILKGGKLGLSIFEELQQCTCPKLTLLMAANLETRRGIRITSMPSLSVLTLENIALVVESECQNITTSSGSQEIVLHGLVELQKLGVSNIDFNEELAGLDALSSLRSLRLRRCRWLRSLDGLSGLVKLQDLNLLVCKRLGKLPDMRHLTCLKRLRLILMDAMEEVGRLPSSLESVTIDKCHALKRMPDVSSLTCLKSLNLTNNKALEEVEGDNLCSSLVCVLLHKCPRLTSCPRLDECNHLTSVETDCALIACSLVQKLPDLPSLQDLCIEDEASLIKKIDVGCLTNLQRLFLKDCGALEEVAGLTARPDLFHLSIKRCPSLVELSIKQCPRLETLNVGCPSLKKVLVEDCEALKEIRWDSEALPSCLQELRVQGPNSLREGHVSWSILPVLRM